MPAHPEPSVIELDRMIHAIAQVENGRWGKRGGICNMKYEAWKDRTALNYRHSADEQLAMPVYRQHLLHLIDWLPIFGVKPTISHVATCWECGLTGGATAIKNGTASDYGKRVRNLYLDDDS